MKITGAILLPIWGAMIPFQCVKSGVNWDQLIRISKKYMQCSGFPRASEREPRVFTISHDVHALHYSIDPTIRMQ